MANEQDKTKVLYDAVSKDYDIGTFNEFSAKLQDPTKRKAFYDGVGKEYDLGTFDDFSSKVSAPKKKDLSLPSTDFSASSQFLQEKPTPTIPFRQGVEVEKPKVKVNRENIIKRAEAGEVNPDLNELADLNQRLIKGGVLTAGEIERGELDKGDIDDFTLRTRAVRDLREKSIEKSKALENGAKKIQEQGRTLIQQYEQAPSTELKSQIEQLDKDYQLTLREYKKERYKQDIYEKRLVQTSDSIKRLANEQLPDDFFSGFYKGLKGNINSYTEAIDLAKKSKKEQIEYAKTKSLQAPTKEAPLKAQAGEMIGGVAPDAGVNIAFSLAGLPGAGAAVVAVRQGAQQAADDFVRAFNQAKEEGIETGELDKNGNPILREATDDEAYDIATKAAGVGFGTGALEGLAGSVTGGIGGKLAGRATTTVGRVLTERAVDVGLDAGIAGTMQTGRNLFDRAQGLQTSVGEGVLQNMAGEVLLSAPVNVVAGRKEIARAKKASNAAKEQLFDHVINAKDNPEELKKLTENLEIIKNQGLVTESEYNDIVKKAQQYEQALPTIPEEIKNKKAAADLIIERNDLAEKAQTVDEAYKKPIEERIKQINEELLQVDSKPTPKPAAEVDLKEVEITAEKPTEVTETKVEEVQPTETKVETEAQPVEQEQVVAEEVQPTEALKDIESTAKALEELSSGKFKLGELEETPTALDVDYGDIVWQQSGLSSFNKGTNGKTYITDKDGKIYEIQKTKLSANNTFLVVIKDANGGEVGNFEFKKQPDGSFYAEESYVSNKGKGLAAIAYDYASQDGIIIKPSKKLKQDGIKFWSKSIAEAYHKAKADGSSPELVKAVEDLLGKPTEVKAEEQPAPISEIEQAKKELKEAREAFRKASAGLGSLGNLQAIPEFVNLVKKAVKLGVVAAKDFYNEHKDLFNNYSEKDINDAFENAKKDLIKKGEVDINKVINKISTELKNKYNKLAEKVNKLKESAKESEYQQRWKEAEQKFMRDYELAKQKGESEEKLNKIKSEYETEIGKLNDKISEIQYQQRWKEAEANFIKEYELAKQKGASDAKLKEMTDKYKSKVKSLEEELKQEKKERRYELKYLEAEANTVKDWLGENKSLLKGLTDAEYQRLTKKLTGTGLRSDIDDVMEYLDKMVGNADYNNKLSQAKKLNKGLKLLSKSKSTLVNEREALKKFISVKPSSSWDVAKLDEYNKFAEELIDSVSPVKNVKGKPERKTKTITTEQIDNKYETLKNDYDNEVLSKLIKDNAWYFINKKFTIEDIDKIKADLEFINGKDLDAQKQALERLDQRKEFKEAMKEIVSVQIKKITNLDKTIRDGFSKDDNLTIDRLENIDVNKLDTKQLIKINNILNNIETNGDFSDDGYVDVIAKFQKAIPKIDGILKNSNLFKFKNTKIWDTIRTKRSLDAIMQRLTLVNRTAAAKLNVAFGDTDLSLNNVKVNDFAKKVLETIQKYEDTKPSVKDEHTNEVVAYLIQNTATTDKEKEAQFKQAKDNLKTSYENLKRGNKDEQNLGKLQEEIYKDLDLDNVNNQQQLIDKYSKMNKTAMDYLFKMQKIYEEIEPLFRKNQEKYNNTTYPKIQYYTPIKHRTLSTEVEEDLKGEEEYLKSSMGINASMSKSSIKRVGMNKNQYIDTDFNKLMYTRANDIANQAYTLPDRAFMHELFNSKEFLELFGEENARVLRDAFESKVNHVMNKYPIPSKTQKKINDGLKPLDRIINLSSVRALNGALQSVKQMVVLVNTISDLTLSGNADLIDKSFKAKWDKSFETFLERMPISLREGTKGGTNLSKDIDEITESKIRTELENLYKAYGLSTENMAEKTLYFLRKGDSFPAELSWAAYYMESLKNQGIDVDNINWEEENNKINDDEESRKEAIAYAEAKVSSKQNVSDPANVSELIANKDVLVRIVRSLVAPLSSYAINTRNRLNDDLLAIAKGGDKKAAAIDITATLAELYAYGVMINVISAFILEPIMEMMLDEFGFDPEKDPREWDEILKDIFTKKAAWSAMADFLTTGTTIFGEKYGKDALNSIYTALNGKTKNANDYFNITPEESKKNEKEQNDYDRTLPFRTKTLTETFGKAGTLGILLDLSTNTLSSLSYVYDDEARMKEGVRLGKTRVEGLKKGEFEKSFISPVELTPNEEKFFAISGMISATTMLIPMFSEITSVNRMAYQKAIRQAKAKYGEPERTSAGEPFAKKEPTGFYTNVFKLMDEKENLLKSGLSSSVKNEKLKEIDEKLKREYMRRTGVNEVKQEQFSRFLRDLTRQRGERIKRGLR